MEARLCFRPDLMLTRCAAFWTLTAGSGQYLVSAQHKGEGIHHRCFLRFTRLGGGGTGSLQPTAGLCETAFHCAAPASLDSHCFCQGSLDPQKSASSGFSSSSCICQEVPVSAGHPTAVLDVPSLGCLSHRPPSLTPTPT